MNNLILDEIISIEEYNEIETIDITLNGNNLFFANDILTHNSALTSSDVGMENTAESIGLAATLDGFFAVTQPDELKDMNQYLIKQLKNRFGDISKNTRFTVGVDKPKMRIYDLEESAQDGLVQEGKPKDKKNFSDWS